MREHLPERAVAARRASWAPRPGVRFLRRPVGHWTVVLLLAVITAVVAHQVFADASRARHAWGATRPVATTTEPVEPGESLGGATAIRELPLAVLPADALGELPDDAVASRSISAGAIVTVHDLAGEQAIGSEELVVAVPVGATTPPTNAGAAVSIIVHPDPFAGHDGDQLAARVVGTTEDQVLVAVPWESAQLLASALAGGGVTIALSAPG